LKLKKYFVIIYIENIKGVFNMIDLFSKKNLPYFLYMSEAEGIPTVDTRESRLNQIGRALRDMGYAGKTVPAPVFDSLLYKFKVNNITTDEIHQIERKWL
jgi:hypothetical protein